MLIVDEATCQTAPCDLSRLLFSEQTPGREILQVFAWSDLDINCTSPCTPVPPPPPSPLPEPSTWAMSLTASALLLISGGARIVRKRWRQR